MRNDCSRYLHTLITLAIMGLKQLPIEIVCQVSETSIRRSRLYTTGARWLLVSANIARDSRFRYRSLYEHWLRLDVENEFPRFRVQAAIAGDVDVSRELRNVWGNLLDSIVPIG